MTFVLAVFAYMALAPAVHAQGITSEDILSNEVGEAIGTGTGDIRITIARIIRAFFGLLGTVALLLVLYAGFLWMTAAGEPEKVDRAKKTLASAVIGLVIMMSAFAITSFIISRLLGEIGGSGGTGSQSSAPDDRACIGLSATCPAGALGNGIVESHFPLRGATGIARNTRVVITFKEAIDPASVVVGGPNATVAIMKATDFSRFPRLFPLNTDAAQVVLDADDLEVAATEDGKTFVFMQKNCPTDCLGSPSESMRYDVILRGGSDGLKKKASGSPAFTGTFGAGYLWEFQVSTVLDLTPPQVRYATPSDGDEDVPRNSLVQVTFNEAVDPISVASGLAVATDGDGIPGVQAIGNSYRSVEFRTNEPCGTNSCGETVYCLPAKKQIDVRVKANGFTGTPPRSIFPPNGVTDMAGNSLDGDGDGTAEGPTGDDYAYAFDTSAEIDLTPPRVIAQAPATLQGNIPRDLRLSATFSKQMSYGSMTSSNVQLVPGDGGAPTNYWVEGDVVSSVAGGDPDQGQVQLQHDLLSINQGYAANMTSGLRDLRQNCFYPGGSQTCVATSEKPFCCNGIAQASACAFAP